MTFCTFFHRVYFTAKEHSTHTKMRCVCQIGLCNGHVICFCGPLNFPWTTRILEKYFTSLEKSSHEKSSAQMKNLLLLCTPFRECTHCCSFKLCSQVFQRSKPLLRFFAATCASLSECRSSPWWTWSPSMSCWPTAGGRGRPRPRTSASGPPEKSENSKIKLLPLQQTPGE